MTVRTNRDLLNLIRRTARGGGGPSLSAAQFQQATGIHASVVKKRFGTWNNAVRKAGLKPHRPRRHTYDDPLLDIYRRCCTPPKRRAGKGGKKKRGGGPRGTEANATSLQRELGAGIGDDVVFFEPRYESGVVLLFGVLAERLGFRVLVVRKDYPDMLAWRRLPGTARWEQLLCEFEVRSKDFRLHGHDPSLCDLIICWRHNYPECPVEVLELSKVVREFGDEK